MLLWVFYLAWGVAASVTKCYWVFYLAWVVAASVTKCYWVLYWLGVFLLL